MKHSKRGYTALRRVSLPSLSGGIDRSRPAHLIRDDRLHEAVNVWWRDGVLRTRPALHPHSRDAGAIAGTVTVTPLPDSALVCTHNDTQCRVAMLTSDGTLRGNTLNGCKVSFAVPQTDGAVLYFDNATVRTIAADGSVQTATPYVPCVLSTGRATKLKQREDNGARIEAINLLTPAYTCRYTTDGEGIYYWLPEGVNAQFDAPFTITYTTAEGTRHTHTVPPAADVRRETTASTDGYLAVYEPSVRCFYFTDKDKKPVALPIADAADNLTLATECVHSERFRRIYGMRCGTAFASRVFVAGAPDHPHRLHWSAAGNPLYFPENNDAFVGDTSDGITAFGKQDELLVVFKEHSIFAVYEQNGTTVTADALLSGAVTDAQAVTTLFPVRQIHGEVGCTYPATIRLCGDTLVWMAADGRVYALFTGGTYDARRVRPLSAPIEPLGQTRVSAARYGDRYVLVSERQCVVLDYEDTGIVSDTERVVWFSWEFPESLTATDIDGELLLIGDGAVYGLSEDGDEDIAVRIVTKQYELGAERYKQVCAVTVWAVGDATLTLTDGERRVAMATITNATGEPYRIPVSATRLKRCGLTLQCRGALAVDRIQLVYRRMGEIRE